jgi:type I restriction enzyme S subunit
MSNVELTNGSTLPHGWARVSLAQIAQINPALDRCVVSDAVPVNFVPMRAVEPEGGGLLRPEVRPYGEVKKGYTAFLSGDVITAKITPCMENGKTTVVPELPDSVCFGSTEFHVIRSERGVEAKWIANYLLQHSIRRLAQREMSGGVGQMRVPASFLDTVEIPVPPSLEQQRIVTEIDELLSDLDAGGAALERAKGKLKQYRAAVLNAAVEGALTTEWRSQNQTAEPATALLTRILAERRRRWEEEQLRKFKEAGKEPTKAWKAKYREPVAPDATVLPSLPKGWCWATGEQLAWASGYGTSEKCRETNAGIAVLRIPNIIASNLDLGNLKYAPAEYSEADNELVDVGDLLIVRTNGSRKLIGRGAVIHAKPTLRLSFASYLIRLRLIPLPSLLKWISFLWESSHVRQWIETRAATSAGQFNISLSVLETLAFPLPPEIEQEELAEILEDQLSVIEHLEADLEAKVKSAQSLRQSLLRHAFTGQLVPQDPNDEPATELMQRIAAEREERALNAAIAKRAKTKSVSSPAARKRRHTKSTVTREQ